MIRRLKASRIGLLQGDGLLEQARKHTMAAHLRHRHVKLTAMLLPHSHSSPFSLKHTKGPYSLLQDRRVLESVIQSPSLSSAIPRSVLPYCPRRHSVEQGGQLSMMTSLILLTLTSIKDDGALKLVEKLDGLYSPAWSALVDMEGECVLGSPGLCLFSLSLFMVNVINQRPFASC